jgi:hypothetical protein
MKARRTLVLCIASVLAASAWAQKPPKPLNLELPPGSVPASSSSATPASSASTAAASGHAAAAAPATSDKTSRPRASAPGVYYGDTSGRPERQDLAQGPSCDDSTYNQAQVHGSVGMGVVTGNRVSGNYQTGTINFSKATGSCEHPTGGVRISIGVGQGDFNGRGWRH